MRSSAESGWDRRRRRVAEHIEQTALELFAKRGYHNVSLEDVSTKAGMSTRTVARYFACKEDLLLARPRRGYEETVRGIEAIGPTRTPVSSVWQKWLQLTEEHQKDREDFLLWNNAFSTAPDVVARALGEYQLAIREALTALCAEALDIDPDGHPGPVVLAACVAAATGAVVEFWAANQGKYDLEGVFAAAMQILNREFSNDAPSIPVAAEDS